MMSRIYFHSENGEAELRGSERAYMGLICSDVTRAVLRGAYEWIAPVMSPSSAVWATRDQASFDLWLGGFEGKFVIDGEAIDVFTVTLNTALRLGGNTLKLMARLHGQREIHCWAAGEDRPWLAGLINAGRKHAMLRDGQNWESVADFLRTGSGPVVCSYSVCDSFPNSVLLPKEHPALANDGEAFYELSVAEQWAICMPELEKETGLQLSPRTWDAFKFGAGHTAFDLRQKVSLLAEKRSSVAV